MLTHLAGEEDLLEKLKTELLAHSQGMFRWVQIWLDICLPINWTHVIDNRKRAERYLEKLKEDGTSDASQYELLKKGYHHLWKFNRSPHPEERDSRILLFRILLAAMKPLTINHIKHALCLRKTTFDPEEIMTTEKLIQLGSGFLAKQKISPGIGRPQSRLEWVHESARAFISGMTVTESTGDSSVKGGNEPKFPKQMNHHVLVDMLINVVGNLNHGYWTYIWKLDNILGHYPCKLDQWVHYMNPNPMYAETNELIQRFLTRRVTHSFLTYLVRHGLTHCKIAASRSSIFDPVWERVLREVVLSETSALGLTLLLLPGGDINWRDYLSISEKIRLAFYRRGKSFHSPMCPSAFLRPNPLLFLHKNEAGDLKLLFSHVLAGLNIVHEADLDLTKRPTWAEAPEMRSILKDAAYIGEAPTYFLLRSTKRLLGLGTALSIAVYKRNRAAVEMLLESRKFDGSEPGRTFGTISNAHNDQWCMKLAKELGDINIVNLLREKGEVNFGRQETGKLEIGGFRMMM